FVKSVTDRITGLLNYSSILFGFETALLDLIHGGDRTIFKNKFTQGQAVPINGLIWMSGMDLTLQQIEIKIQEGFTCLKLKVGGIDFEKECDILQYIRRKYFKMDITIRLDANEAFKSEEVMYKLHELSKFDIQSIEQPLKVGSPMLPELCAKSPIPIALDEELIGKNSSDEKKALLASANPHFIILKPSLHGGFSGCRDWISTAEELKIGWWMTSALESSVGLNAIAQFTAEYNNQLPQGLGTGKIYDDNFESPLSVKNGFLSYSAASSWTLPEFD
ncbi:MAG: o-succinylbenzoate synthase, partial [Cyclobacteriaceae bacterium]